MGKLDGKVALITGGARGQGRSHAVRLAEEGAQIIICDIASQIDTVPYPMATTEDLAQTVRLVEEQDQRCLAVQADARDLTQMSEAVSQGIAQFGRIDIAVINHGICIPGSWDTPAETFVDTIDTNLKGAFLACRRSFLT
jgi:NAD(P)-dependent dehydrogenase (short-subunit alcohol dehydrogenase family)